jgi:hypothetical protein
MSTNTDTPLPDLTGAESEELLRRLSDMAARRRRSRRIGRLAATFSAVIVLGGAMTWALASLGGLGPGRAPGSEADAANYRFENVRVGEYVDPATGAVDPDKVAVTADVYWTTGVFPGDHECVVTLYGPDGNVVDRQPLNMTALSRSRTGPIAFEVSELVVDASIACDATRLDTPVAIEIANPRLESFPDPDTGEVVGLIVAFDVRWPEGLKLPDYPGTNSCTARVIGPAGDLMLSYPFTTSGARGPSELPGPIPLSELGSISVEDLESLSVSVECEPFTGTEAPQSNTSISVSPIGERFLIASGETESGPWHITVYQAHLSGGTEVAWCLDLDSAAVEDPDQPATEQASVCSLRDGLDHAIGPVTYVPGFRGDEALLYGQVSSEVAHLEITFGEGTETAEMAVIPAPEATGLPVGYFATFVAGTGEIEIVAIAFIAYVDEPDVAGADYHVYVMSVDGREIADLTPTTGGLGSSWSPDGSAVAYEAFQEGTDSDIFVAHVAAGRVQPIVDTPLAEHGASWSPDGTRIAFEQWPLRDSDPGDADIYTVAPDGSGPIRLTGPGYDVEATWSPHGSRIAFASERDGDQEIYVISSDGSGEIQVSRSTGIDAKGPAWSPDGTQIAFQAYDGHDWDIWVAKADGTEQVQVTNEPGDEVSPIWSPDGTRIAFLTSPIPALRENNDGTFDVHLMHPDGTDVSTLTEDVAALGGGLSWQPVTVTTGTPSPTPSPPPSFDAEVAATMTVGADGAVRSVVYGEGAVWVAVTGEPSGPGTVLRIDPTADEIVATIPITLCRRGRLAERA